MAAWVAAGTRSMVAMESLLTRLGSWLIHADFVISLLLLVGFSISMAHVFALLANRLSSSQILVQLLLDSLVLSLAFFVCYLSDIVLLKLYGSRPVHPALFLNGTSACLVPAIAYILAAAPYIGDLIAVVIWACVHLNVISFLHVKFGLPFAEAWLLTTPGFGLALILVWLEFRQSWRSAYSTLASELTR